MFKKLLSQALFKESLILAFIIFLLDRIIAVKYHLYYWSIGGEYDSLVHFFGGMLVGVSVLWFYYYSGFFKPLSRKYYNFFTVGLLGIIFVGISWEMYELLAGLTSFSDAAYAGDTSLDLFFDTLGTILACIYAFNRERKERIEEKAWIPN